MRNSCCLRFFCLSLLILGWGHPALSVDEVLSAYNSGQIQKARSLLSKEWSQALRSNEKNRKWRSLSRKGWLEMEEKQFAEAYNHYKKSLALAHKTKDPKMEARSLSQLGWFFLNLNLLGLADAFYSKAIAVAAPKGQAIAPDAWMQALQEQGSLKFLQKDFENAEGLLLRSLQAAKNFHKPVLISESATLLAQVAIERKDFRKAEVLAKEAVEASQSCGCSSHTRSWAKTIQLRSLLMDQQAGKSAHVLPMLDESIRSSASEKNTRFWAENILMRNQVDPSNLHSETERARRYLTELLKSWSADKSAAGKIRKALAKNAAQELHFFKNFGIELKKELFQDLAPAFVEARARVKDSLSDDLLLSDLRQIPAQRSRID